MSLMVTAAVVSIGSQVYSAYSSNKASQQQSAIAGTQNEIANRRDYEAIELSRERLADQQARQEEWEQTFGGLEENLSKYYNNLDPDDERRAGFEAEKLRHQTYVNQVRKEFGSIGNTGSNTEQLALAQASLQSSQNISRIDQTAEQKVIQEQSQFLKIGLDKEAGIQQDISNAAIGLGNSLDRSATSALGRATSAQGQADVARGQRDSAIGGLITTGVDAVSGFSEANPLITKGSDYY